MPLNFLLGWSTVLAYLLCTCDSSTFAQTIVSSAGLASQPIQSWTKPTIEYHIPAIAFHPPENSSPAINGFTTFGNAVNKMPFDDATSLKTRESEPASHLLTQLIENEKRIQETLPSIFPAVVAIEGGSGVIVRPDGVILTASHVTRKANRIVRVQFANGRVATARTLGTNTSSDTAALKLLDAGPWPHLNLGDSDQAKVGDWCIALGYPLSFNRGEPAAVRVGRILKVSDSRIVTDCTIMGGDSGGPLVNLDGQVIAISSRVKTGITDNFHVPVRAYQKDWHQLAAAIDVRPTIKPTSESGRAYLGVLGETDIDRVRIRQVIQGSPAQTAGMKKKDVILEVDGNPVSKFDDVLAMLENRAPGEKVFAKLNRFGTLINVSIQLGSKKRVRQ